MAIIVESMLMEPTSGSLTTKETGEPLPLPTEGNEAVPMPQAKMSPVKHGLELFSDQQCTCCRDALASAAHELKTPLAIMGGYLHLLLAQKLGPLNPRQVEVLSEM